MHRALAAWLIAHPWQTAIIAACLGVLSLQGAPLFVVLASAVPVLMLLARDRPSGVNATLAGSMAVIGTLLGFKHPLWFAMTYALALFGLPLLLGEVLRRWGSLNLVFQLTLLVGLAMIGAVFAWIDDPAAIWVQLLHQAFTALTQAGFKVDAALIDGLAASMWGAFTAVLMLANFSAVLLARWWQSLLQAPGEFGREFRELRSGVMLGTLLIVISAVSLLMAQAWLDSMAWVAMMGLALQGLASVHRHKVAGRLQRGWLVAIYVLLIVPLFSFITVALLAGCGLADFWRRLRSAAQPS